MHFNEKRVIMELVEIVTVLALLQYLGFGILVGRARARFGVKAPATTGHEMFERLYRVQMNTLEQLVIFLPALWMAARHVQGVWVAGLGAIFILGRFIYLRAYTRDPASRSAGYALSIGPALILLVMALMGAVKHLVQA
jgi:glutathione S-transferase